MKYSFNKIVNRYGTNSAKWDFTEKFLHRKDILPLWVADMDFLCCKDIIQALKKRAVHGIYGYTDRNQELNDYIVKWYSKRHNVIIDSSLLSFAPGVVPSLNCAVKAFSNIDDKIVIQPPVYYPFYHLIKNNNRIVLENNLINKNGKYIIDFDDLENKLKDNRTKIFILCNPHNPVGRVWDIDELNKISELCLKYNVIILSDDIHSDFVYEKKYTPIFSLNEKLREKSLIFSSPSKTFNLAGLNTSFCVIPDKKLKDLYDKEMIRTGYFFGNTFGDLAMETAYKYGEKWLDSLLIYLKTNIDYLTDFFCDKKYVDLIKPEGTYLVWMDFKKSNLDEKTVNNLLLDKAGVGLENGKVFGTAGTGYQRLNAACPLKILQTAINNIDAVFSNI